MALKAALLAASLLALAGAGSLRSTPAHLQPTPEAKVLVKHAIVMAAKLNATDEQWAKVAKMRTGLQRIANHLEDVAFHGDSSKTSAAAMMRTFEMELTKVLNSTIHEKNVTKALLTLKTAQASLATFTQDITARQTRLMKEGSEQQESLLLGVLMQRKTEPMAKQLEVLQDPTWKGLDCVTFILKGKDRKTPLFQQVATYLDAHADKSPQALKEREAAGNLSNGKIMLGNDGKPDLAPMINALTVRLQHQEETHAMQERYHDAEMKNFDKAMANKTLTSNKMMVARIKSLKKSEERKFKKMDAQSSLDIKSLKQAIDAIKKGDMKELAKAQAAIQKSLDNMRAHSGKFIYLIQMVSHEAGLDCPYCAAQCVDKCHSEGKPYVQCLTDCADAGK